ncbi:hypothetical protein OSL75_12745, partial [Escherichia coli]|nr:hypothetical protein [Escherichia coli]
DRNRSHWSTSKTPSYTKSVSWQHHLNGVAPTEENIRNGTYPYIVDAYMVTRENPTPETQKFVDWFISQQGQQLVEDVGYVLLYEASPESSGQ